MRATIQLVKWWPIVTTLVVMVSLFSYLVGFSISGYASPLFGCSLFTAFCWLFFSKAFKFCLWHRLFIYNLALVSIIVIVNNNIYKLIPIFYVRSILLLCCSTILISSILYFRYGCFKSNFKGVTR